LAPLLLECELIHNQNANYSAGKFNIDDKPTDTEGYMAEAPIATK
jgi:hypothetical protein